MYETPALDHLDPVLERYFTCYPPDDPHHRFDGKPWGARIDWILVSLPFKVKRVANVTDNQEGRFPSDHFPYEAGVDY